MELRFLARFLQPNHSATHLAAKGHMKQNLQRMLTIATMIAFCSTWAIGAENLNPPPPKLFTLSGTFKVTDIIVNGTTQSMAYDPARQDMRATILATTQTTGGGAVTATTNQSTVVSGSFNDTVKVTGGLTDLTTSTPHTIQKDQTIPLTFSLKVIVTIWASDAPGTATATTLIDNPIPPPTYQLVNNVDTGNPKTTTIGPTLQ